MKLRLIGVLTILVLSVSATAVPVSAAVKAGAKCKVVGQIKVKKNKEFTCTAKGKKLVWRKEAKVVTASGVKDNASEKENSSDSAQKPVVIPTIEAKSFASGITSNELLAWTKAAIAEMKNPPTSFLSLIWPIGVALDDEPDPGVFGGDPFAEHSDILSASEIKDVSNYFRTWQTSLVANAANGCKQSAADLSEGADRVERWIKGAANVATAPDPCFNARAVTMAWTAEQSKYNAKTTFFHEAYHGLSNYLLAQCSPILKIDEDKMNYMRWFAEGTADYFGHYMAAKNEGRTDHKQRLLARFHTSLITEPNVKLDSNTYPQAAAMILMMERGLITEEKLVNGSYFNDCKWINTFDPANQNMKYIFNNFSKIKFSGGVYSYTDSAING